jgi:hypothetical protein
MNMRAGTFGGVLFGHPRSVVGMTFMLVSRGAQAADSMPAGFESVEAIPNEPRESKVSSRPDRMLS